MSSVVSPYGSPPGIRSALLRNPSETIPPTEELEALHAELKLLRQKTLERARKAGDDLRTIEDSMRRMREKEKGKSKALEKVKKERGFTPLPHGDEGRPPIQPPAVHRGRPSSVPSIVVASSASTPSLDPRKALIEDQKKKIKKKRKLDDLSDVEAEPKTRKTSPLPPHTHPHPAPAKATKFPAASALHHTKSAGGPDFSVPASAPLLPIRPPVPAPPIPGPSKPTDVTQDFSKSKQPSQVLVNTFYTSIEPWIRPIKEEDIGFLEYTGDEVEPYIMPKLGRHYTEVWEELDTYGGPLLPATAGAQTNGAPPGPSSLAPLPRWEPSTLMEGDLVNEERHHGPLTERLVSALIPMQNATEWKGVKAAEEAMEGRPGTNGAAAQAARDKLNVADLEDRIKNVMRFYGLIESVPDFSEAVDDPIATALRHAQRELRTVVATNKARKARLAAIARDRLGYQEYLDGREALDKNITGLYTKLQRKDVPKVSKKKKKGTEANGAANGTPNGNGVLPPPRPAALGLGPDEENRLVVPDQLKQLVETRRQWVDAVGGVFDAKEKETPGRIWGLPSKSIYEGIEDEVRRELERVTTSPPKESSNSTSAVRESGGVSLGDSRSSKGKARARVDEMELG